MRRKFGPNATRRDTSQLSDAIWLRDNILTVDVTSTEHTSQWNLVPASVPREAVFFRITPIDPWPFSSSAESDAVAKSQNRPPEI